MVFAVAPSSATFERDDAAEGRGGVGGVGGFVGVRTAGAFGDAAGVGVFDDHAGRRFELAYAFPRGVGVGEIVVAELLALQLRERGERARHRPEIAIERAVLMRVFAVAQIHHFDEVAVVLRREQRKAAVVLDRRQIVADERVVLRDTVERGDRQREAGLRGQRAEIGVEFFEDAGVLRRIGGDRDAGVVFRGGSQHRGAADVDVLDDLVHRAVRIRRHRFERIQVQYQQIDRTDAVFGHHRVVDAGAPEQTAVDQRMQRFHAAVHHFREAGEVADIAHLQAGVADDFGGAAGGQQFDVARGERTREVEQTGLVGHGQQRASDRHRGAGQRGRGHERRQCGKTRLYAVGHERVAHAWSVLPVSGSTGRPAQPSP
jgi:hypothetical protein